MMGWTRTAITFFFVAVLVCSRAECSPITVSVNTAPLAGDAAQLAFDFIDGGPPSNTVTLTNVTTNGVFGSVVITGGVAGGIPGPIVLSDTSLFNEFLIDLTLGTAIGFTFDATENPPGFASVPDSFSLFLLDPSTGLSPFPTTEPTGSDSLLQFDVTGGSGTLTLFTAPGGEASVSVGTNPPLPVPVPEPMSLAFVLTGIGWSAYRHGRR
jgi:hypothetical protein